MTDQNELISRIQKLNLKMGDVLIFFIKTDNCGNPLMDFESIQQTAEMVNEFLSENGAVGLFLMDKICLFSIGDANAAIKRLENFIFQIREAVNQVPDIENGKSGDVVKIEMDKAEDSS